MKPIFSPSLMCLNYIDIKNQLNILNQYCDMFHVDVMDGHFAKNFALSPDFVRSIRDYCKHPLEIHLMIENPSEYIDDFVKAGADFISVQSETIQTNAFRILRRIKDLGCKTGVVLCPATPLESVEYFLDQIDLLTIMTVDVGYAGQTFIPEMLEKIRRAEKLKKKNGFSYVIQCDGAIGKETYKSLYQSGARAFVMGTTGLFKPHIGLDKACQIMKDEFMEATGVSL